MLTRKKFKRIKKYHTFFSQLKKTTLFAVAIIVISIFGVAGEIKLVDLVQKWYDEYSVLEEVAAEVLPEKQELPEKKVEIKKKKELIFPVPDKKKIKKDISDIPILPAQTKPDVIEKNIYMQGDITFERVIKYYKRKFGDKYLFNLKRDAVKEVHDKYKSDFGELSNIMLKRDYLYFEPKTSKKNK